MDNQTKMGNISGAPGPNSLGGTPSGFQGGIHIPDDPFHLVVAELVHLHDIKKADYANAADQFSNFIESAEYAGVTVEQAIDVLIGTKIARLRNLKKSGKSPLNESIQDTEKDLIVYGLIKKAWQYSQGNIAKLAREINRADEQLYGRGLDPKFLKSSRT